VKGKTLQNPPNPYTKTSIELVKSFNEFVNATNEAEDAVNEFVNAINEAENAADEFVNAINEAENAADEFVNATNEAEDAVNEFVNAINEAEDAFDRAEDVFSRVRFLSEKTEQLGTYFIDNLALCFFVFGKVYLVNINNQQAAVFIVGYPFFVVFVQSAQVI
jgi:methyl-accepting chemotaxis protein